MSTQPNTMRAAISEAIAEQVTGTESKGSKLVDRISTEQRAALESKFNTLALEIRSAIASKYPGLSTVEMYMLRQMVKEANGKLASNRRPVWYNILTLNAASLKSGEESIRKYAETQLRNLAEELDSKESSTLLKKYKNSHDATTKDTHIIQLCGIFGVSPTTIA